MSAARASVSGREAYDRHSRAVGVPLTHLRHGARQSHVPVLLVHVDRVGAAVVAHPDAEVLHLQRLLLEDLRKGARGTGWSVPVLSCTPRQPVPAQPLALPSPQLRGSRRACAVQPAPSRAPSRLRHPPPRQGPGKWAAYLVARHDLAIHALDPLELSDEVPEFALRAHLWTRRPTLASARGDRRSARAFSPRCAASQTTAMPSVSPASPCTPAPARAPAGSAASFPAPLR